MHLQFLVVFALVVHLNFESIDLQQLGTLLRLVLTVFTDG